MMRHLRSRPFAAAVLASLAAVTIIALVQGRLLFRRELATLVDPPFRSVNRVALLPGGRSVLVFFSVASPLERVPLKHLLGIRHLSADRPKFEILCPELTPHRVAAAAHAPWVFVATCQSDLYVLDLREQPCRPTHLGRHDHSHPALLECSQDGSIVIMAGLQATLAWDRDAKRLLWRRDDLAARCAAFLPGGKRFVCGLDSGAVLELDALSGATLRKLAEHSRWVNELAVSPRGDYVASLDLDDRLVVTDLVRGREVWSRYLRRFVPGMPSALTARPAFSPGGETLAVVNDVGGAKLAFLRPRDGRLLGSLPLCGSRVRGFAFSRSGEIFTWDYAGIITLRSPASGEILDRCSPARWWAASRTR